MDHSNVSEHTGYQNDKIVDDQDHLGYRWYDLIASLKMFKTKIKQRKCHRIEFFSDFFRITKAAVMSKKYLKNWKQKTGNSKKFQLLKTINYFHYFNCSGHFRSSENELL